MFYCRQEREAQNDNLYNLVRNTADVTLVALVCQNSLKYVLVHFPYDVYNPKFQYCCLAYDAHS
jgi:hypothetical protein